LVAGIYGPNRVGLVEAGGKCTTRIFKICNLEK
jgi:hypothetical protein